MVSHYNLKVKVEDCTDCENSSDAKILEQNLPQDGSSGLKPSSGPVKEEEPSPPSSSSGQVKSHLIGMGFSPTLVDQVIEENGEDDINLLLEALFAHSAPQKSSSEAINFVDDLSSSDKGEDSSPLEFTTDDDEENEELNTPAVDPDKKASLLMMDFSVEEVDLAINRLGENASFGELVDFILAAQATHNLEEKEIDDALVHADVGKNVEETSETLFGLMDKTLCLLQMGFTEDEVSTAIDNFGPEVPILELADSIFASRIAYRPVKEEEPSNDGINIKSKPYFFDDATQVCSGHSHSVTKIWGSDPSSSNASPDDSEEKKCFKKFKHIHVDNGTASSSNGWGHPRQAECEGACQTKPKLYNKFGDLSGSRIIKEEMPHKMTELRGNVKELLSRPPYFFYGNVVDVSQDTWRKLSQFLYGTQPEFINSQFFSAFIRKEGYIHNLPTTGRSHILPKPPVTIEDALPHTRRWWPSWDTRKQLSCISSETTGVAQLCEQLGKVMADSQGMLSKEQQTKILHQCKTLNLMWVGDNKLKPIEPDQVERILGYPIHHTRIWGLEPTERLEALKYCFQTDTVGYLLSVLKGMYPDGLRVLSVYSGIGGAEVALHRLGIHLKCVVSVEASDINRKILKRWWQNSGQFGELKQIGGIEKLTIPKLEEFVRQFGGFDIIIAGNPGAYVSGSSNVNATMGMDLNLFFEFVRVFQRVRGMMERNG